MYVNKLIIQLELHVIYKTELCRKTKLMGPFLITLNMMAAMALLHRVKKAITDEVGGIKIELPKIEDDRVIHRIFFSFSIALQPFVGLRFKYDLPPSISIQHIIRPVVRSHSYKVFYYIISP